MVVWKIRKGLDFRSSPSNHSKFLLKLTPVTIYSLAKFNDHPFYDRKDISKNVSCTNTLHCVLIFQTDGKIKNRKTSVHPEWSMVFHVQHYVKPLATFK